MAITVAVNSDFQNLTGKTLSIQSELTSKLLTAVVTVTFGACDNYASCGNTVDLSLGGRIGNIIEVSPISNNKGLLLEYVPSAGGVASTGKVKAYGVDPAAAGGAVVGLVELPNASTQTNSAIYKFRVVGF